MTAFADRLPGSLRGAVVPRWLPAVLGALAWPAGAVLLPNGAPAGVVLIGAILGSASALTAVGLVLVWRSARLVNFAVAAMGAATGLSAIRLHTAWGWPYPVALAIGVIAGTVTGVVVEFAVIRRFVNAPRLVATVATLGLAQLLGGVELLAPPAIFGDNTGDPTVGGFETPLSHYTFRVGAHLLDGNHVLIAIAAPLMVAALWWFLRRSLVGTAIRGAAQNRDWARLIGIDVAKLSLAVWSVAGAFAAATYLLQAPFVGTSPQATAGPTALMIPLAAALVARLESIPVAFGSAIGLGALDQVVRWNATRTPALSDVVILGVILLALSTRRGRQARTIDDGGMRILPPRRRTERRWSPELLGAAQVGAVGCALVAAVAIPRVIGDSWAYTLAIAAVWAMVAVSTVVVTGWTGQLSLGQFAFVGLAATVAGNLVERRVDFFVVVAVAAATGMVAAAVVGLPALRIRGPFLGIATLAFALAVDSYLLNPNYFPDLLPDSLDRPVLLGRWTLESEQNLLAVTLVALVGAVVAAASVRRSRSGRHLLAARDNPNALAAQGASSRIAALKGFVLSGAITGVAGALHVLLLRGVRVGTYRPVVSVESFASTTIGGLTSLWGSVLATFGLRAASDAMSAEVRLVTMGVGVLLVLWLVPGGLAALVSSGLPKAWPGWLRRGGRDAAPTAGTTPVATAGTTDAALASAGLDVAFGRLQVLFDVDITVAEGELLALLGTNGAGKSTWLKAVMGLVPSSGTIAVGGERVSPVPEAMVRSGVALMMGGASTFAELTVDEHLRLAGWTRRHDPAAHADNAASMLERFPALARRHDSAAGNLSGGEQQQLALAQALLLCPRVLLIDELSLGLAPSIVGQLIAVLRRLHDEGTTIVIVEQSVNVATALADRAVFMEKGQVRFTGPTKELAERPDLLRSIFFAASDADDSAASPPVSRVVVPAEPRASGRDAHDTRAVQAAGIEAAGVEAAGVQAAGIACRGVTKRFGGLLALHDVDLDVRPGEIVGLIGQNGAGKSTLLDCLGGFQPIDGGSVELRGRDVTAWSSWERALAGIGRSFQDARLFPALTVAETVSIARERHVANRSMFADAFRQPRSWSAEAETAEVVERLLDELGLDRYRDEYTTVLSTGTRRVVEMACLLASEASVLLLDEPSAGVAQRESEALVPLLRRVRDQTGAAVVIVEHDMPLLRLVCDRLVAMVSGTVIAQGTPDEVLSHHAVIASYLGDDRVAVERSGAGLVTT